MSVTCHVVKMMSANESGFQKIYAAFQPKILRYLTYLAGESEAEDLTQETFVKIHQGLKKRLITSIKAPRVE